MHSWGARASSFRLILLSHWLKHVLSLLRCRRASLRGLLAWSAKMALEPADLKRQMKLRAFQEERAKLRVVVAGMPAASFQYSLWTPSQSPWGKALGSAMEPVYLNLWPNMRRTPHLFCLVVSPSSGSPSESGTEQEETQSGAPRYIHPSGSWFHCFSAENETFSEHRCARSVEICGE